MWEFISSRNNTQLWNHNFHSQSQKTRWQIHIFQHVYLHFALSQNASHTLSYSNPCSSSAITTWSPFKLEIPHRVGTYSGSMDASCAHLCTSVTWFVIIALLVRFIHDFTLQETHGEYMKTSGPRTSALTPSAAPNWVSKVPQILLPASHLLGLFYFYNSKPHRREKPALRPRMWLVCVHKPCGNVQPGFGGSQPWRVPPILSVFNTACRWGHSSLFSCRCSCCHRSHQDLLDRSWRRVLC